MQLQFPEVETPDDASLEAGRLLFAGETEFLKGVVAMSGLPEADHLSGRQTLRRVFVLIDARHGAKAVDEEIMSLLDRSAVTFQAVLTKTDKLKGKALEDSLAKTRAALAKHPAAFPEIILTSSEKGDGIATLRAIIAGID